jgi:gluconokinase
MSDTGGRLVLTLDVGTSSVRAMLWDENGDSNGVEAEIQHSMTITPDGGVETDPRDLVKRTARCIDLVLEQAGRRSRSIAAVGISTFWHSLMGVDSADRPLTPLYTWADTRSQGAAEQLKQRLDEQAVHARTGCMLHSSYLPAKLLWLSESQPDTFARARYWLSFGEYLFLRLFNRPMVSLSMASGTGLFDQDACAWDGEVMAALPASTQQLGELTDAHQGLSGLRGRWSKRWPALADIPWYPALGDGACSSVGSNCSTRERIALMIGTSGALRVLWRASGVAPPQGLWRYRLDHDHILIGGALSNGGNLVRWLDATLRTGKKKELLAAVAGLPPDGHGLTVLPFLDGERSPSYRSDARGAIVGLSLSSTPEQIVRACLESVGYRFGLLLDLLTPVTPDTSEIVVNGGAILNRPVWLQIISDILGRRLIPSSEAEATSRGAALMALRSLGAIESIEAVPERFGRAIEPDEKKREVYSRAAARHADLYERLLAAPLGQDSEAATASGMQGERTS